MRSALTAFRLFQPDTPLRNAYDDLFILTTLFYLVGAGITAGLRLLSLFWLAAEWRHGGDLRPLCVSSIACITMRCAMFAMRCCMTPGDHQLGHGLGGDQPVQI